MAKVPESPKCYRCGTPGHVDWIDVSSFVGPGRYMPGESYCVTPGCTDEDGSRQLEPLTVEELRRRADAAFLARHKRLVADQ